MGDARRLRQLVAGLANASVVAAPAEGRVRFQLEIPSGEAKLRIRIVTAKRGDQSFPTETSCSDPAILSRWRKLSSVAVTTVEKIVELHEGTLEVCDSPGGLFSVSVTLPLVLADADGKPVDGATRGTKPGGESKAPLILLADDEDIIRTITRDYLESTGYRVLAVTNGREALDLIHAEAPDLVIMDMQMPVLDGMEALQQLRRSSDPKIASTPVISLSGLATPGHREKCLAAGATSCLAKPFGIKDLDRAIQEAINKKA
jgi:CheY-like chemotaxis protein